MQAARVVSSTSNTKAVSQHGSSTAENSSQDGTGNCSQQCRGSCSDESDSSSFPVPAPGLVFASSSPSPSTTSKKTATFSVPQSVDESCSDRSSTAVEEEQHDRNSANANEGESLAKGAHGKLLNEVNDLIREVFQVSREIVSLFLPLEGQTVREVNQLQSKYWGSIDTIFRVSRLREDREDHYHG
jgi:hypothetical protein